jgi:hypothetical protein
VNDTLKRLGGGLKKYFRGEVRRPLNWRMIDAIETLKEVEAARSTNIDDDGATAKDTSKPDK